MKILFMTNVPSPYRVDFFNELGKLCDLTVTFEKNTSDERDKSWSDYNIENFNAFFLRGKSISSDMAFCPSIIKIIKNKQFDYIICADFSSPTGILAIQFMKMFHIDYYLEADGGIAKQGNGIKERIKRHLITSAKGCFSTSNLCDNYFKTYGALKENIRRYPFTSLYDADLFRSVAGNDEKNRLRELLGMEEKQIVLSVGRFSYLNGYGKGYDVLLKTAVRMPQVGWYIIGDNPTEEFVKMKQDMNLENVHFIGYKTKEELKKYYRSADLFVLMTIGDAWGLVINEAMACGLPVITTNKCVAGVELLTDGYNGYVINVGDDAALENRMLHIFQTGVDRMGENALKVIQSYTIENMAKVHAEVFSI